MRTAKLPEEVSDPRIVRTNINFLEETIRELEQEGASAGLLQEMRRRQRRWQARWDELEAQGANRD